MLNIDIDRRSLLLFAAASPILASCKQADVARWVAAEQAIGQEFIVVAPELARFGIDANAPVTVPSFKIGGVTVPPITTTVSGVGTLVRDITSAVGVASTAAHGQSVLITVETYINALVPVIWPAVAPFVTAANPGAGLTIGLIVAALPAIEGMLNFAIDFGQTLLSGEAQKLAALAPPPVPAAGRVGAALKASPDDYLNELLRRAGM